MRILQISDKVPRDGGVGAYVADVSTLLEARGHEISHLRLGCEPSAEPAAHHLPWSYGFAAGWSLRQPLREVLRATRPDVVHVHGCFTTLNCTLLAELRRSLPVIGTLHDVRPFCYLMTRRFIPTGAICERRCGIACFSGRCALPAELSDLIRLPRRSLMNHLSLAEWRRFDRVVVPSGYLHELALQHDMPAHKLRRIPHGTHVPPGFPRTDERSTPALIMYLGALVDYKGPDLLVEALVRMRSRAWQALILGEGPLRAGMERAVARHGLADHVRFRGHIGDRDEIRGLLGRARLLALPSRIPESFALAGIEALAAGTPVVSFGHGGVREWLRDGETGLVAADEDSDDFARQMGRLVDDPALAESLGRRGRELVSERFTDRLAVDRLIAVYHEARDGVRG